jgi:hypothetical protein
MQVHETPRRACRPSRDGKGSCQRGQGPRERSRPPPRRVVPASWTHIDENAGGLDRDYAEPRPLGRAPRPALALRKPRPVVCGRRPRHSHSGRHKREFNAGHPRALADRKVRRRKSRLCQNQLSAHRSHSMRDKTAPQWKQYEDAARKFIAAYDAVVSWRSSRGAPFGQMCIGSVGSRWSFP